jgi:hypothetical protein
MTLYRTAHVLRAAVALSVIGAAFYAVPVFSREIAPESAGAFLHKTAIPLDVPASEPMRGADCGGGAMNNAARDFDRPITAQRQAPPIGVITLAPRFGAIAKGAPGAQQAFACKR